MRPGKRARGVTLIEMLIGLTVLGILLMLGMPSYTTWIQSTKIRAAAESLQAGLQLARAEARWLLPAGLQRSRHGELRCRTGALRAGAAGSTGRGDSLRSRH